MMGWFFILICHRFVMFCEHIIAAGFWSHVCKDLERSFRAKQPLSPPPPNKHNGPPVSVLVMQRALRHVKSVLRWNAVPTRWSQTSVWHTGPQYYSGTLDKHITSQDVCSSGQHLASFILIIIIIIIISSSSSSSSSTFVVLMQGIYNYVPQTHHVSMVCTAAALLQVQFMVHVMFFPILNVLHFYIITSHSVRYVWFL
jgi:hypothetical protein